MESIPFWEQSKPIQEILEGKTTSWKRTGSEESLTSDCRQEDDKEPKEY
jgi:hypothetical protein